MPTLADLIGNQTDPTITQTLTNTPVVEPLDGPSTVDDVMDRFPEEVYQQGRDTHLYRFLTALAGDAGVGVLKAQTYAARLLTEAEFLNFQVLDQFYAAQFAFHRLRSETYPAGLDPSSDALTPDQWDSIQLADQAYRHRVAEFFTAIRFGNSPQGMAIMAQAGCGVECEIVENYKGIYDQMSDDPLGLEIDGTTASTQEFIVVPRFINDNTSLEFQQLIERVYSMTAASLTNARPATGTPPARSTSWSYSATGVTKMVPDVERNVIELLDHLRPTDTLATIKPEEVRYSEVTINGSPHASSVRTQASRLVTGNADVPWPDVDPSSGFFIQASVENEVAHLYGANFEYPTIFLTIENIHAYTEQALLDPDYGTSAFYTMIGTISPFTNYQSEQAGAFSAIMQALFPFLANLSTDATFIAFNAVAANNTPLIIHGRAVAS